jgi:signal transduction histidine kinase
LLEVNIPIHARGETQLLAAAQLLVDGRPLLREYARIDQHLWWIALGLYAGGAALLSGVLVWAYRRLRRAHQQLADRTARLLRANHELSLAAKTSALGSVTAHLIHGLSNPLANLQHVLAAQNGQGGTDMGTVAAATHRMQQLVDEVVRVLGEERVGEQYELTLRELADILEHKLASASETAGVPLQVTTYSDATLNNRTANLTLLILENLVHNALKVSPSGRAVRVEFTRAANGDVYGSVTDEGPGLPPELLPRLFTPCRSTHGGNGLGLAISKQLANQLGADLDLAASTSTGSVFTLRLPARLFQGEHAGHHRFDPETTFTE